MSRLRSYIITGVILAGGSGVGLYQLITKTLPYLKERWAFFFLFFIFLCGFTLPVFALMNRYFFTNKSIVPQTIIREAIGFGILIDVLVWFRMGHVLNTAILFLCVGGFVTAEVLIRARETVEFREGLDKKD